MNIFGKVAIVTGASSGIGEAVALELVRRGVKAIGVVDMSDNASQLAGSINQFTNNHVHAVACVGDVTDEGFRRHVFDEISSKWGIVQILVPAAGITRDALTAKVDRDTGKATLYPIDDFRRVMEVNLVSPVYWALELAGRIAEDRHARGLKRWKSEEHIQGTVVFIGSVSSRGNKGQVAYAATKAGLEGAARTLMMEALYHGVRCAVIHPGFTDTPLVHILGEDYIRDKILPNTQLGRLILPEEIADAICFMIANSAVSGELWADAGWQPSR
jgi:NAD(P)-dependent dehydrogenase (short-subunit alcohol dehydrogenase family)